RQPASSANSAAMAGLVSPSTSSSSSRLSNCWITVAGAASARCGAVPGRSAPARRAAGGLEAARRASCEQHAQMGGDAARERAQVVAAFEARDDAARGVPVGDRPDLLGDPAIVVLDEAELAELVFAMRIEPRRDEDHL